METDNHREPRARAESHAEGTAKREEPQTAMEGHGSGAPNIFVRGEEWGARGVAQPPPQYR